MRIFGYLVSHSKTEDPKEKFWSNTIHGNRHHRIFSLEKVVSSDGIEAFVLYTGKHQIQWAKLSQKQAIN